MKCYPEIKEKEEMRKIIGRYGLTGKQQVSGVRVGGPQATGRYKLGVCFFLYSRWLQIGALKSQGTVGGCVLVSDMPLPPD